MKLNKLIIPVLVLSGLLGFLLLTSPRRLPLVIILVPFASIGLLLFLVSRLIFLELVKFNPVRSNVWAGLVAFEGSMLLLLSSLHQITWKDMVLAVVFGVMFVWYFGRVYRD